MGRGVNTGALSPVGGIGEIRMRANPRKIVAYKDFAKVIIYQFTPLRKTLLEMLKEKERERKMRKTIE